MDPPTGRSSEVAEQAKRYCGLRNHYLQEPHKTINSLKLLKFARKVNNELTASTLVCGDCLDVLQTVYMTKMRISIRHRRNLKVPSSNRTSDRMSSRRKRRKQPLDEGSTTYAAGSAKRHRLDHSTDEDENESLVISNAANRTRLPQFVPMSKRREFARNGPEMDIYFSATTGL